MVEKNVQYKRLLYSFIQNFGLGEVIEAFVFHGHGYDAAVGLVLREGHLLW